MRAGGPERDPPLPTAVHLALQDGQFIDAIKLLRNATGSDLKTAKLRVERAAAGDPALRERLAAHLRAAVRRKFIAAVLVVDAVFVGGALPWWFSR